MQRDLGSSGSAWNVDLDGDESREDLKRRVDLLKAAVASARADAEHAAARRQAAELALRESLTELSTARATAATFDERLAEAHAATRAAEEDAAQKTAAATERLRSAPLVDAQVRALYLELRAQLAHRLGAAPMKPEETAALHRALPLVVLDRTRVWLRRAFGVVAAKAEGSDDAPTFHRTASLRLPDGARRQRKAQGPPAAEEPAGVDPAELQALQAAVVEQTDRAEEMRRHAIRTGDIARREAASAKYEVREYERTVKQLKERLQKQHAVEVSAATLQRAKREVADVRREMQLAVAGKQQEVDMVRRTKNAQLKSAYHEIDALRGQVRDSTASRREADQAKAEARGALGQLARADVRQMSEEKRRAVARAERSDASKAEAEKDAATKAKALRVLQLNNAQLTDKYNALFAAHLKDRRERDAAGEKAAREALMAAVTGPDSALCAQHYRQRYAEVKQELRRVQRRMKQLMVLARRDELGRAAAEAALEEYAAKPEHGALSPRSGSSSEDGLDPSILEIRRVERELLRLTGDPPGEVIAEGEVSRREPLMESTILEDNSPASVLRRRSPRSHPGSGRPAFDFSAVGNSRVEQSRGAGNLARPASALSSSSAVPHKFTTAEDATASVRRVLSRTPGPRTRPGARLPNVH